MIDKVVPPNYVNKMLGAAKEIEKHRRIEAARDMVVKTAMRARWSARTDDLCRLWAACAELKAAEAEGETP